MKIDTLEPVLLAMQQKLYGQALSLTANRSDALDLLQSTSLKALDNKEKLKSDANVKGWLFTIMRNLFINDYKSFNKRVSLDGEHIDTILLEEQLSAEEDILRDDVKQAIESLPNEQRIPFGMYSAGFKYAEIAQEMDIPLGTVKSRIHASRMQLQEQLADYKNKD